MAFAAKILADSISLQGVRITTFELTYPRIIHAEFMTHRMFSRNAASSRAIPVEKLIKKVKEDPFIPEYWGRNQSGMQAEKELDEQEAAIARTYWLQGRDAAVATAENLLKVGLHKQLANRVLEPFQWYTVLATATEYDNFFALRCHRDAQPEIRRVAVLMRAEMKAHTPMLVVDNGWHLPLTPDLDELYAEFDLEQVKKISAGRCARVSYETHDGRRDPLKDIELCERLVASGHMSPLEHVARPAVPGEWYGNFKGWKSMRKYVPNEHNFALTVRSN